MSDQNEVPEVQAVVVGSVDLLERQKASLQIPGQILGRVEMTILDQVHATAVYLTQAGQIEVHVAGRVFVTQAQDVVEGVAKVLMSELALEKIATRLHRMTCTATPVFLGRKATVEHFDDRPSVAHLQCMACGVQVDVPIVPPPPAPPSEAPPVVVPS